MDTATAAVPERERDPIFSASHLYLLSRDESSEDDWDEEEGGEEDDFDEEDWDEDEDWDDEDWDEDEDEDAENGEDDEDEDWDDEDWDDEPLLETRFLGRITEEDEELPRRPRVTSDRGGVKKEGKPRRRPKPGRDDFRDTRDDDAPE